MCFFFTFTFFLIFLGLKPEYYLDLFLSKSIRKPFVRVYSSLGDLRSQFATNNNNYACHDDDDDEIAG